MIRFGILVDILRKEPEVDEFSCGFGSEGIVIIDIDKKIYVQIQGWPDVTWSHSIDRIRWSFNREGKSAVTMKVYTPQAQIVHNLCLRLKYLFEKRKHTPAVKVAPRPQSQPTPTPEAEPRAAGGRRRSSLGNLLKGSKANVREGSTGTGSRRGSSPRSSDEVLAPGARGSQPIIAPQPAVGERDPSDAVIEQLVPAGEANDEPQRSISSGSSPFARTSASETEKPGSGTRPASGHSGRGRGLSPGGTRVRPPLTSRISAESMSADPSQEAGPRPPDTLDDVEAMLASAAAALDDVPVASGDIISGGTHSRASSRRPHKITTSVFATTKTKRIADAKTSPAEGTSPDDSASPNDSSSPNESSPPPMTSSPVDEDLPELPDGRVSEVGGSSIVRSGSVPRSPFAKPPATTSVFGRPNQQRSRSSTKVSQLASFATTPGERVLRSPSQNRFLDSGESTDDPTTRSSVSGPQGGGPLRQSASRQLSEYGSNVGDGRYSISKRLSGFDANGGGGSVSGRQSTASSVTSYAGVLPEKPAAYNVKRSPSKQSSLVKRNDEGGSFYEAAPEEFIDMTSGRY
ncbi:hypothetical protein BDK51DRAFT_26964 [Blyttiomyces helicus]|uniref:FERM domain-containing protein n=1 Tax=Blyttiomyces helicus TaxID=388810 RepID=A0A4P9WAX6_9FUNG|nr:hypothetical protein BDK51DRAFT_26964 [Blyttiomyces helicus]|eukprot:RKO88683.1 hypothetical protein BDK51DRAFT_26964 [Blyttiomyces helicus]